MTQVVRPCDADERGAHVVRGMLCVNIPGRRRGLPNCMASQHVHEARTFY